MIDRTSQRERERESFVHVNQHIENTLSTDSNTHNYMDTRTAAFTHTYPHRHPHGKAVSFLRLCQKRTMHTLHHTTCSTYSNVCIYLPINSVCENAVSCRTTTQTNAMFFRSIASVASLYTANCHTVLVMVCVCMREFVCA